MGCTPSKSSKNPNPVHEVPPEPTDAKPTALTVEDGHHEHHNDEDVGHDAKNDLPPFQPIVEDENEIPKVEVKDWR